METNFKKFNSIIAYHGSKNSFDMFDEKMLGTNMGRTPSNMGGFFFLII